MKRRGERIAALTAYDYTSGRILDEAGVPFILVGDTLGMVVLGYDSTLPVTIDAIVHHTKAVTRGVHRSLVIGDMPFMTYRISRQHALENAARIMQEGGCRGVKVEGGCEVAPTVARLTDSGIPVCGHLGYTPQSTHQLSGPRLQGRSGQVAERLVRDAEALQEAGAFAIVLELLPSSVAREITGRLDIPAIGIGSGPHCDGEIQVFHDVFGLFEDFVPRHTKRYLHLAKDIREAARRYSQDVNERRFPGPEQTADVPADVIGDVRRRLGAVRGSASAPGMAGEPDCDHRPG